MKKTFDCVAMKKDGAAALMTQLAVMNREQQLQFWQEHNRLLHEKQ